MDCSEIPFIVYCGVLSICTLLNFIFALTQIVFIVIIIRNQKIAVRVKDESSDDLKSASQTPLLFAKRPKSINQAVANEMRDTSLARKEYDQFALEAIYGTASLEVDSSRVQRAAYIGSLERGKVAAKTNMFEKREVTTRARSVEKHEIEKKRVNELSDKFKSHAIPKGLQLKEKEVEKEPTQPEEAPKVPTPKKKKVPKKDPPSIFKLRHQRGEFLDQEFANLVDQTNQRLADYTLGVLGDDDVQIFANQRVTSKNIKRSQLEFNKDTFLTQPKGAPARRMSDHKNMMLMAQSVYEDFDFDLAEKKATSMQSVASRQTQVTAISHESVRK